jgi:heme/copper-type cytochrome/quinol oxidase subunit 3
MNFNKKGQLNESINMMILVFAFVISIFLVITLIGKYNTQLGTMDVPQEAKDAVAKIDNTAYKWFDTGVLILLAGMFIIASIVAYNKLVNPAFIFVILLLMFALPFLGMIVANLYSGMVTNSTDFALASSKMPLSDYILSNSPYVILLYLFIVGIFYYMKPQEGIMQ